MFGIIFKLFPTIWWLLKITVLKDKKKGKAVVQVVKKGSGMWPFVVGAATAAGALVAAPYVKAAIQMYREDSLSKGEDNSSESSNSGSDAGEFEGSQRASSTNHENN